MTIVNDEDDDNDLPTNVPVLTEDQTRFFPHTEEPRFPTEESQKRFEQQLENEKLHGHPAWKT